MYGPVERHLEVLKPNLSPEESCLLALLDLNKFQEPRPGETVSEFYEAYVGETAPEGLRTRISTHTVEQGEISRPSHFSPQTSYVDGYNITATVAVVFDAQNPDVRGVLNLDFVKTPEGLQLVQRQLIDDGDRLTPRYTRIITEDELSALGRDATTTKERILAEDTELMRLGSLVEKQAEDGSRRFHIGDILSITTGIPTSPRGIDGIHDILRYMTDDNPATTQSDRFAEECRRYLEKQLGEIIGAYSKVPEIITDSRINLYEWLQVITEDMGGDPFLKVHKINKENHAVLNPVDELLLLDYGPNIMEKVIKTDPNFMGRDDG